MSDAHRCCWCNVSHGWDLDPTPPVALPLIPDDSVGPGDCEWGTPFHCRVHCPTPTTEQERDDKPGILATVRELMAEWHGDGRY